MNEVDTLSLKGGRDIICKVYQNDLDNFCWNMFSTFFLSGNIGFLGGIVMASKSSQARRPFVVGSITVFFVLLIGVVVFKVGLLTRMQVPGSGLSGLVSVRGSVGLENLRLTKAEISTINKAVDLHRDTFVQVILTLDVKGGTEVIKKNTEMAWSLALETNGNCEVRSWNRKVKRDRLVKQMVSYMAKAAREYKDFKKFPDVEQNFKTLYI